MAVRSKKALTAKCDRFFSVIVRSVGHCEACGIATNLQCAHGFSRRYRTVRWDERNAFALCRACHVYYTHRPLEWDEWLRDRWGNAGYDVMRNLALNGPKPDLQEIHDRLKPRYDAIKEAA